MEMFREHPRARGFWEGIGLWFTSFACCQPPVHNVTEAIARDHRITAMKTGPITYTDYVAVQPIPITLPKVLIAGRPKTLADHVSTGVNEELVGCNPLPIYKPESHEEIKEPNTNALTYEFFDYDGKSLGQDRKRFENQARSIRTVNQCKYALSGLDL